MPLLLGIATRPVSLLLCACVLAEAAVHWAWWGGGFPSWHVRQSTREHFFVNCAVAGGLVLLQNVDGGGLTLDALLAGGKRD